MSTLSVLYIIRNEEALIEKSLNSIKDIADEIIIIDTGSCDKTLQICRKFRRTKILSHNWIHDFSKTRNYGIQQCSKEWILSIDGDEMLDATSASRIKGAIATAKSNTVAFGIHVIDHEKEWGPLAKRNEKSFFKTPQTRVFKRDGRILYSGKVQESVDMSVKTTGMATDILNVNIHHYLWRGKQPSYKTLKLQYYNKLGANFEVNPIDPLAKEPPPPPAIDKVGICILAFNALNATKKCIQSINEHTKFPYELFLIDNGSTDGTSNFLYEATGKTPIRNARNTGVAKGKNVGAQEMLKTPHIKYMCFMDNDTMVHPGWLEEMVKVIENDPKIGLVGPMSTGASGTQNLSKQYSGKKPREISKIIKTIDQQAHDVREIDGFCMLARTTLIGSIGLFDDSFGTYGYEDKDFCRRVKEAGCNVQIASRALVEHGSGASIRSSKANWSRIAAQSAQRYAYKWKDPRPVSYVPHSVGSATALEQKQARGVFHPLISIVILTCNRLDVTKHCIQTVMEHTSNYELIVVDNGSTDGTLEFLESTGVAKIIRNNKNLGVPKARNQGIRASNGSNIVLMDNDVTVRRGWLHELFWELQNGYDIVGIEAWKLNDQFAASMKCTSEGQDFSYLGGACCMFRRSVFEKIGLLDEGFSPAYYEDVEICIRAKNAGLKMKWKPTVKIRHVEHCTLVHGQKDFSYQDQLGRSYVRFAQKMRGEIKVEHELLPSTDRKLKILYLGMQWDYGVRERGLSFEHNNFYPSLMDWKHTEEVIHFDFVDLGKQYGIPKMSTMLMDAVNKHEPDVLFSVFFDPNHDPNRDVVKRITEHTPTATIGWFCDSHWRYDNFDKPWSDSLNFNVTTSASAHQRYVQDGLGGKIIKSQWAASPIYKKIPDTVQDIGVSFIGQPHGDRRQVIDTLRKAGINIQVFGTGWGKRLNFDEMISVFNRSKINLNLSNASDARFKQIKGRNFEVPGCGGFLLTELAENLSDYYEPNKEIGVYSSVSELPDIIRHYLTFDEERQAIADAAYARTMQEHTYTHRFETIFHKAGLI